MTASEMSTYLNGSEPIVASNSIVAIYVCQADASLSKFIYDLLFQCQHETL